MAVYRREQRLSELHMQDVLAGTTRSGEARGQDRD
jgi:hypothetical protein